MKKLLYLALINLYANEKAFLRILNHLMLKIF